MKNATLLVLFFSSLQTTIYSQFRYVDSIFSDVIVQENIEYGLNADNFPVVLGEEAEPQVLKMDVYSPADDAETDRPLIIMISPGGYLPFPINQEVYQENRKNLEIVYMADRLAKYGYVVAVIDLRLGWNPTTIAIADRSIGFIKAVMRQCQDLRTAVRFFRKSVIEGDNGFGIDIDKIVGWGDDSGALPLAFAAYINDYLTEFVPNYIIDVNGVPMVMWSESIDGDIYALEVGINPENGDTLSYPNHPGFSSDLNLAVQQGGAFTDTITISPEDPPLISFQSFTEGKYPWWNNLIWNPTIDLLIPLFGTGSIHTRVNNVNLNEIIQEYTYDNAITFEKETRSAENPLFFPTPFPELFPFDSGHSTPWSFWDPDNENNDFSAYTSSNQHSYCKSVLDTIIDFYAPRACVALGLVCHGDTFPTTIESGIEQGGIIISPNPVESSFILRNNSNFPISGIHVFDIHGRLVKSLSQISKSEINIERGTLSGGIYFVKIFLKNGFITKKLVFI